jgi:pimeloyl-ACP methyl ester carboxylesterase
MNMASEYIPKRLSTSEFIDIRGLRYHLRFWQATEPATQHVLLLHGWMDVGASFQFLVDCLPRSWSLTAADWRGYGLSQWPATDSYGFADYIGDLDFLLDHMPHQPTDIVAHSLGGNVAMLYAGIRPERIARLVNLEGLGMSAHTGAAAPQRYAKWLAELREVPRLRTYESHLAVAQRLQKNNPRLREDYALYLANHWAALQADGQWHLQAHPAHKLINANLYRVDEVVACWQKITAPVLLVMSDHLEDWAQFSQTEEYAQRLANVPRLSRATLPNTGHMLHHDQPQALATMIEQFFKDNPQ